MTWQIVAGWEVHKNGVHGSWQRLERYKRSSSGQPQQANSRLCKPGEGNEHATAEQHAAPAVVVHLSAQLLLGLLVGLLVDRYSL